MKWNNKNYYYIIIVFIILWIILVLNVLSFFRKDNTRNIETIKVGGVENMESVQELYNSESYVSQQSAAIDQQLSKINRPIDIDSKSTTIYDEMDDWVDVIVSNIDSKSVSQNTSQYDYNRWYDIWESNWYNRGYNAGSANSYYNSNNYSSSNNINYDKWYDDWHSNWYNVGYTKWQNEYEEYMYSQRIEQERRQREIEEAQRKLDAYYEYEYDYEPSQPSSSYDINDDGRDWYNSYYSY